MATATNYDPAKAGFRVSATPITRKSRQPSTKPQPKPRYADAVWYTFNEHQPLEVTVPTRAVDDTVRLLKRSARYLERHRNVEVRVQISVEPVMVQDTDAKGEPLFDKGEPVMVPAKPAKSVVKFMGHKPWMLGRRIAKTEAEAREAGAEAAEAVIAARDLPEQRPAGQHRRTVAGTRPASHRKTALPLAMARAVITRPRPLCSRWCGMRGSRCFCVVFPRTQPRVFASCYRRNLPVVSSKPRPSLRGQTMGREGGLLELLQGVHRDHGRTGPAPARGRDPAVP